jgi:biotin carboxyl carrier protein
MPGTVIKVYVREGQRVEARQRVVVLEAMKMEHVVEAPYGGVVRAVLHGEGELVAAGEKLVEIEEA